MQYMGPEVVSEDVIHVVSLVCTSVSIKGLAELFTMHNYVSDMSVCVTVCSYVG